MLPFHHATCIHATTTQLQVQDVLKQNSKQLGSDLSISGFVRVQVRLLFVFLAGVLLFLSASAAAVGSWRGRIADIVAA